MNFLSQEQTQEEPKIAQESKIEYTKSWSSSQQRKKYSDATLGKFKQYSKNAKLIQTNC